MIVADQDARVRLLEILLSEDGYLGITAKIFINYERIKC
jgi:hypothetical protein